MPLAHSCTLKTATTTKPIGEGTDTGDPATGNLRVTVPVVATTKTSR